MKILRWFSRLMLLIAVIAALALMTLSYFGDTERGMQIVWAYAKQYVPEDVKIGSLSGRLFSEIELHDLAYKNERIDVKIESLKLRWNAWKLINKHISIQDIDLDGVRVRVQAATGTSSKSSSTPDTRRWLEWLSRATLDRATIRNTEIDIGDARIIGGGTLDDTWHLQWSVNIPDLRQILPNVSGKVVTTGTVTGQRMLPAINATVSLNHFVAGYVKINALSADIDSQVKKHLTNNGKIDVTGLSIDDMRIPDFKIETSGQLHGEDYLQLVKVMLSPVNKITAQLTVPKITSGVSLDQTFKAAAQVNVADFSQFNTLFADVPQVRGFKGVVTGSFQAGGKFTQPVIDGGLDAVRGSVFVPAANMTFSDIVLHTHYHTGKLVDLSGTFVAGQGKVSLTGTYGIEEPSLPLELTVRGTDILAVDTKEYTVKISPDMTLSYHDNDLFLGGSIMIPYADIRPIDFSSTVTLPSDVVIVHQKAIPVSAPTNISMRLKVVLGDSVNLKYHDLQSKLQGSINIAGIEGNPFTATGEFSLVGGGTYRAYGRRLNIQQGRLIYAGNLLSNPGISLRATQTIKVKGFGGNSQFEDNKDMRPVYVGGETLVVGIAVSGVLNKPRISLFSDAAGLSQGDILSYLLFGYPQSQVKGTGKFAILNVASEMYSDSGKLNPVDDLQKKLGLTELSVGSTEYFDFANNATQSTTTVNIGRNLGHNLSLHYSYGLFQEIQVFSLRYQINKHLAVQTETSTLENGGDLLYQLESAH